MKTTRGQRMGRKAALAAIVAAAMLVGLCALTPAARQAVASSCYTQPGEEGGGSGGPPGGGGDGGDGGDGPDPDPPCVDCSTCPDPECVCPQSGNNGNTVYYVDGFGEFGLGLPLLPDGSRLMPQLYLSYSSGSVANSGCVGQSWELTGYPRLHKVSATEVHATLHARSVMTFVLDNGNWVYKNAGTDQDVDQQLTVPGNVNEKIVLKDRRTGREWLFWNFDTAAHEGMPYQLKDRSGNTVDYALDDQLIDQIVDGVGRTIGFTYDGRSLVTEIDYGLGLKVESTYDNIARLRKVDVRRDDDGDDAWTHAVHSFWYVSTTNHLAYYVAPEQWDEDWDGTPPDEEDLEGAAQKKWTYGAGDQVASETSVCGGCGGGGGSTEGVSFVHTVVDDDPPDGDVNTVYRRTEHYYPGDQQGSPSITSEVNELGQLLSEERLVDQSKTHREERTYTADGKLEYVYDYDEDDLQNPLSVKKYTYDGSDRVTKVEISQSGANWTTTTEYAYSDGNFPRFATTVKHYEGADGSGLLQTDYEYYADGNGKGRVETITYPEVNHNLDEAGGNPYRSTKTYTYDSLARVSTVTDEDGMVTKYVYADDDDVNNDGDGATDETDEWGGQLVEVIVDYGEGKLNLTQVEYEYSDTTDRMTVQADALGNETTYAYSDDGSLANITAPGGLYVEYAYDLNGNRTSEVKKTSSVGTVLAKAEQSYDQWGQVTEEHRWYGSGEAEYAKTVYTYDSLGRVERVESHKDQSRAFAAVGETTYVTITKQPKQLKSGSTDGANDTLVTTTSYKYGVMGSRAEVRDVVNDVAATYAYDWRGRNTSITGPEGYYVAMTYDNLGRVTESKRYDTNAQGTLLADSKSYYDEMGRVYKSQLINPGDVETADTNYYYSQGGKLKKRTDPYSESTTYAYDTAGRPTTVTDPLGNQTVTAYYDDGRAKYTQVKNKVDAQTYITYSRGQWYDDDGNVVAEADYGTGSLPDPWPANAPASSDNVHVASYTLDKLGRATQATDPAGMQTTYAYDLLGRKTQQIQDAAQGGLGIKVTWQYDDWDANDEVYYDTIEAWQDAQNHQDSKYYYGAAKQPGAVTTTAYPDSGEVTVAYNDDGTVHTRTDQRGWTVTYSYDDAKRVTEESVSGQNLVGTSEVTYAHDALGRPTSVTDNNDPNDNDDNSTVGWTYTREADGDLAVEETQEYGTMADRAVTYTYDLSGRLKTMEYPSGLTLTYGHDDLGRVTAVNDGTSDRVADTHTGYLLQKREYANGTYLTYLDDQGEDLDGYGYDAFGRIKNHRWMDSEDDLIAGWHHDYDRLGNKKYQEDLAAATQSELYGYDAVYRLDDFKRGQLNQQKTDVTNPTRTQTWTLDPLGNWDETDVDSVAETRVHSTVNELTARTVGQDPQISLTYDDAGNLTQDGSANGDHQYVWDYRNRLIEVKERQAGNWNTVGEYRYDARTRRVLKVVTNKGALNGTTRFLWGGDSDWQCLEERDGGGDLVARYTYSPGYIDAVAAQERDLNADDDFGDASEVVYYLSNTLFSVYALTNAGEAVVERYRYDAYGTATVLDGDWSGDADGLSDVGNRHTFTGRRLDAESSLMQYRHRYYSLALGRFVSRDPVQPTLEQALYEYALSRPGVFCDPRGLSSLHLLGTAVDVVYYVGEAGLIALHTNALLNQQTYPQGKYQWDHAHCVQMCMITAEHHDGARAAFLAGLVKELADLLKCILTHDEGACYSAFQGSDLVANFTGMSIGEIVKQLAAAQDALNAALQQALPGLPDMGASFDYKFHCCVVGCDKAGWGPNHVTTPPSIFYNPPHNPNNPNWWQHEGDTLDWHTVPAGAHPM